jgi:sigma-E factor negative regulatory protein RseB
MDGDLEPAALVASSGSTTVSTGSAMTRGAGDDKAAVDELRRAVVAPRRFAYAGVRELQSYDAGDISTLTVDVHHSPGQGTSFGFQGDGSQTGATFLPESDDDAANGLDGAPLNLLIQAYDLTFIGPSTLLGRRVSVIAASRGGVLDARFWIDDATGLLLRREMYDHGTLVRTSGFTFVRVSRDGFLPHLPPELEAPGATPVSMTSAAALNDDGWTCPGQLGGAFVLTDLEHVDTAGDVMRATYTDGLSTISLFEERGSLDPSAVSDLSRTSIGGSTVYVGYGLPTVAVWQSGATVYTVVTDATHDVAMSVLARLPHQAPGSVGIGDRLRAGLGRLGSFVTPAI